MANCSYGGARIPCPPLELVNTFFGFCYTLLGEKSDPVVVNRPGFTSRFTFEFDVNQAEYTSNQITLGAGARVREINR